MIPENIAAKFHLPTVDKYPQSERDYYTTFLSQSDYIVIKRMESELLGETEDDDYEEIIACRKFARQRINEIDEENTQ